MKVTKDKLELRPADIQKLLRTNSPSSGLTSVLNLAINNQNQVNGRFDLYNYKNKACIGIKDLYITKSFTSTTYMDNMITIEVILKGGANMQLGMQHILNNDMPKMVISSHNKASQQSRFHRSNEYFKSIGIWVAPKDLQAILQLNHNEIPLAARDLLLCHHNHSLIYPITSSLRSAAQALLDNPFEGTLQNLFIEGKVSEILCLIAQSLASPELAFNQDNHLSSRKAHAMKKLLNIVDEQLSSVPSLDSIARTIGMNKNSICQTFKKNYGMNITEYIAQKRLTKAKELLLEGKLSVLQVALEVGYTNQSSFGRAFKKFYGYSPLKKA